MLIALIIPASLAVGAGLLYLFDRLCDWGE